MVHLKNVSKSQQQIYLLMLKKGTKSLKGSIGFANDVDIDVWSSDARLKARLYQKKINKSAIHSRRISEVQNGQEIDVTFNTSINRLRQKTKEQTYNSSSLNNRINYLQVDLRRKKQQADLAKYKYHKIIEVRNQSMTEKKQLTKEREKQLRKHCASVHLKASRIKLERKCSSITSKLWISKNKDEAVKLKQTSIRNEKYIAEREQKEVERKKQLVEREHKQSDFSRSKLREFNMKQIQQGKKQHDLKLLKQFAKSEMQRIKNVRLMTFFKKEAQRFQYEREQYSKKIQQYKNYLGKCFELRRNKSKDTFYMTN